MTTRQYLQQIITLDRKIRILTEEIEERRARLENTSPKLPSPDRVQNSIKGDTFGVAMAALADKEQELEDLRYIYEQMREHLVKQILELDGSDLYRDLLYRRYVQGEPYAVIARQLHYSVSWVKTQHTRAINNFAKQYNTIPKNTF